MPVEDLDAIAPEPFKVKKDGKEYELRPTVAAMLEIEKLNLGGDEMPMESMVKMLAVFGLPEEICKGLTVTELRDLVDKAMSHFFPEEVAAVEDEAEKSNGSTPSPRSTDTSEGTPQT
jgi:hypothetical protein